MDHISANFEFGRTQKLVQKAPGGQKAYNKNRKKVATFFLETNIFLGAAKKSAGAPNGNVTPLGWPALYFRYSWICHYASMLIIDLRKISEISWMLKFNTITMIYIVICNLL